VNGPVVNSGGDVVLVVVVARANPLAVTESVALATWCSSSLLRAPTRWRPRRPLRLRRGARVLVGARQPVGGHGVLCGGDVVLVVVVALANPLAATASVAAATWSSSLW